MKFRKKPVIIDAEQYSIFSSFTLRGTCRKAHNGIQGKIHVHTLEGIMEVSDGDWIIKGIKGEYYPVKPDIFKMTYEKVK